MNGHHSSGVVYRHFYNWFLWKVLLPFGFLFMIWLVYSFMREMPEPFSEAFAHGELLIFAAVVLIEVSFEGEELRGFARGRFDPWFDGVLPLLRWAALLIICAFGFIRHDVMMLRAKVDQASQPYSLKSQLNAYSVLNLTVAITCVVIAGFSCFKHIEHELETRLEALTS